MSRLFRIYEPWECGRDGYPLVWHEGADEERRGVKHIVRMEADHRCARCGHPYRKGCGTWGVNHAHPAEPPTGLLGLLEEGKTVTGVKQQMAWRPPLWSPCDERCTHGGPIRTKFHDQSDFSAEAGDGGEKDITVADLLELAKHPMEVQASWRILTVHHLNERKHDLRWWNLVALCQRCHLTIQKKVTMEQVWPTEHTDWFKPYAAGWYSYAYEGRELTRQQVLDDLDRLLDLERLA